MKPGDWMKSTTWLANIGHVLAGYAFVLTVALWSHDLYRIVLWTVTLLIGALAKEYAFDLRYESGETAFSSTVDFLGYTSGAAVAWAELLLQSRGYL
jgi:hypothetical protein